MTAIMDHHVEGPTAWTADTILPDDGLVRFDAACLSEITATAALLRDNPLPTISLDASDFDMPACRALMTQVRSVLDDDIGFAILDRLPLGDWPEEVSKGVYWMLVNMLGQTVSQKWAGLMVYDIADTGRDYGAGKGVRGSTTNEHQGYHTDNSYNLTPNYVSLMCLRPAMEGGVSGLVSFYAAHNILREKYPDQLARLYEPFHFERHREHAPDEALASHKPVFAYDGKHLSVNLSTGRIRDGYEVVGKTMDNETVDALAALDEVLELPGLGKTFDFAPGQIQIVNNRKMGHRRTAFTDFPDAERKRHLVRIWVRHEGRRFYAG